jgi:hypothetical protein
MNRCWAMCARLEMQCFTGATGDLLWGQCVCVWCYGEGVHAQLYGVTITGGACVT